MRKFSLALLCLAPTALAFQLPFSIPFFNPKPTAQIPIVPDDSPTATPRVAIIGAGAGGTSAAFWIGKAKERFGLDVEVDVYDQNDYIGGRSTVVYPYNDKNLRELELGASIFVEANKNLWRATDEFNLARRDFNDEDYETTIWDGENFIFTFNGGWWDTLKILWRYGLSSPRKTESSVKDMLNSYLSLYSSDSPKWDNISSLSTKLGFDHLVSRTISEHLLAQGVSSNYIYEVVEAATLVNYGQDADSIHALEGACSMAASGAAGVAGGNFQLFEQFLNRSGANIYLSTPVVGINSKASAVPSQRWTVESSRGSQKYKGVILAAPFHQTKISVPKHIEAQIPAQPYVNLHVTLLATTSPSPNPAYFGLEPGSKVPQVILTSRANARRGGKAPDFNSLTYHGPIRDGEWSVKIFSEEEITDEWLSEVFGAGKVGWVHRKQWKAYPKLPPTTTFPPVKLDQGFYYVNSFEPFISTMETETISSRNVAELLLNEEFKSGICGPETSQDDASDAAKPSHDENWVLGWDC
ncbi:hypothetical protein FA15DRAFT_690376 [Coprinopsis marcescibilis]|uniref:Prenylcysteine lyase domain-containing protein n=1 Tax=Coprinopsis marcescibilis TaxID=230819 RepID=A0A5C3LFR0_COPMA|nr:hypothetical protein FA15DRAFT_690376 [Coprinopsis marcescibilis]